MTIKERKSRFLELYIDGQYRADATERLNKLLSQVAKEQRRICSHVSYEIRCNEHDATEIRNAPSPLNEDESNLPV